MYTHTNMLLKHNIQKGGLPRVMMKCHHCGRVMTLKNFKEGELLDRVEQEKYYI